MGSPYREIDAAGTLRSLATRPGLTWLRVALAAMVFAVVTTLLSHRVSVDCDRARGECAAADARLTGAAVVTCPLASIRGASMLGARPDNAQAATKVVLDTREGAFALTRSAEGNWGDEKAAMVRELNAFVRSTEPELHASYGSLWGSWQIGAIIALFVLAYGAIFSLDAKVDAERRRLVIVRTLLGLVLRREEMDLAPFRSAEVASTGLVDKRKTYALSRGGAFWVALNSESGERTVVEGWTSSLAQAKHLAVALNEALAAGPANLAAPSGPPTVAVTCTLPFERWALLGGVVMAATLLSVRFQWLYVPFLLAFDVQMLRGFPRRRLLVYGDAGQVVVETSTLGLFPRRTTILLARVRQGVKDDHGPAATGVALLLDDGQHVPLTPYSNVSFGADALVLRVNAALAAARPA